MEETMILEIPKIYYPSHNMVVARWLLHQDKLIIHKHMQTLCNLLSLVHLKDSQKKLILKLTQLENHRLRQLYQQFFVKWEFR